MDCNIKHCIINVGYGGWYAKGTERLKKSLNYHGYSGDVLTWTDFPNDNYDKNSPYNVKAAAFEEALKMGYTHIAWMDCSCWAIQQVEPIFDTINEFGYYIPKSGYNAAQVCSDRCLDYFNVDRDTAEKYADSSTIVFGINYENPLGREFIDTWINSAKDGIFVGSREHDSQSNDSRFLFYRQDQSCATLIANKMGLQLSNLGELVSYYSHDMPKSTIIAAKGL